MADSEALFAEALRIALSFESGFEIDTHAPATGLQAVQDVVRVAPDVAVLDYWLQGMEGAAAVRLIRARNPGQKTVLLSWFHGPADVQEAFRAGSSAFLPKSIEVSHLAEALRRVQLGARLLELEEMPNEAPGKGGRSEEGWERVAALSFRELEILACLSRSGRVEDVAGQLSIKPGTVRIHINHILRKTEARSHVEAVVLARQYGLI
ncbi:MAG: response regulator [Actinomycetota bacterium]